MLLPIEKIIILKAVEIFSRIPEHVLVEVAAIMDEVEIKAEKTLIKKGDIGRCMYIIIDGRVCVHDGHKIIAYHGKNEIIGEMALLDFGPRAASVTAFEDTRLLCLDQVALYELMESQVEVARGIIKVLTQRIRSQDKLVSSGFYSSHL